MCAVGRAVARSVRGTAAHQFGGCGEGVLQLGQADGIEPGLRGGHHVELGGRAEARTGGERMGRQLLDRQPAQGRAAVATGVPVAAVAGAVRGAVAGAAVVAAERRREDELLGDDGRARACDARDQVPTGELALQRDPVSRAGGEPLGGVEGPLPAEPVGIVAGGALRTHLDGDGAGAVDVRADPYPAAGVHGRGVVEQLGEHVQQLGGGSGHDGRRGRRAHLDPARLLRDGGGGVQQRAQPLRRLLAHSGVAPVQQEQALAVAADAPGDVDQFGELGGLGLQGIALHAFQQPQLPVEPGLQPARDAGQGVGIVDDATRVGVERPLLRPRGGMQRVAVGRERPVSHQSVLSRRGRYAPPRGRPCAPGWGGRALGRQRHACRVRNATSGSGIGTPRGCGCAQGTAPCDGRWPPGAVPAPGPAPIPGCH